MGRREAEREGARARVGAMEGEPWAGGAAEPALWQYASQDHLRGEGGGWGKM